MLFKVSNVRNAKRKQQTYSYSKRLTNHFQTKTHQPDKRLSKDIEDLIRYSLNVCFCVLHPDNREYNFSSTDVPVMKLS